MGQETKSGDSQLLVVSVVDCAGVTRGKCVPNSRIRSAAQCGLGASTSWALFTVVNDLAWIPSVNVVGDDRIFPDLSSSVKLDRGLVWAPAEIWQQNGERAFWCTRTFLKQQVETLAAAGISAKVGCEIEFTLIPNQSPLPQTRWHSYGISSLLDQEDFVRNVCEEFHRINLGLEQFHAEFGYLQYEISMTASDPISAIDKLTLAKFLLGRIARRHNCVISFSPRPFANDASNGAHTHVSFYRNGTPLLSGHEGQYGISREGAAIIGGITHFLPELIGLLTPSILSVARLNGSWSGSYSCWGIENREAAVRFCPNSAEGGDNANIEVKCIDASANPYVTCATILIMAIEGIERMLSLPKEISVHPDSLSEKDRKKWGVERLATDHIEMLDKLENSELARRTIQPQLLDSLIAVRRYENKVLKERPLEEVVETLRFAWST